MFQRTLRALTISLVGLMSFIVIGCSDTDASVSTSSIHSISNDESCRLGMGADTYNKLTESEFENLLRDLGCMSEENIQLHLQNFRDPEIRAAEQAQSDRWQERHKHWNNYRAFDQAIMNMKADNVIDQDELDFACSVASQWSDQLEAAVVYVQEYRRDNPPNALIDVSFDDLERYSEEGLELVNTMMPDCDR